MITEWDKRFMDRAAAVAKWSKDPSTKVGAAVIRPNNTEASYGYNGFPRGVSDDNEILNNRDVRLLRTIHAELNAILNARENLNGYTLYSSCHPCTQCAAAIIQTGIVRVVYARENTYEERWKANIVEARRLFHEANIVLDCI